MPGSKKFAYEVAINTKINAAGVKSGSDDVERVLTKSQKRAEKLIETLEKVSKTIEAVDRSLKATDNSRSSGGVSGRWTAEHQAILKASTLAKEYERQVSRIKSGAAVKSVPTFGGGGSSGGGRTGTVDRELQKAQADIRRYQQDNIKAERELTRQIEREAKVQSQIKIRESKQANASAIRDLKALEAAERNSTEKSRSIFSSALGGSFFGNLGANAVSFFVGKIAQLPGAVSDIIGEAVKLSENKLNALKGLESAAEFRGIDSKQAQESVNNLRLVKAGILDLTDAATGYKSLVSAGFTDKQSIDILERFSDAAAFGKQSALSFGEAISRAAEGIKNQNSNLVDNVGLTKNLSVILKERGFELEDLTDKTKGAQAVNALYNGILQETQGQLGDADKLTQGYTGSVAALDNAYKLLNVSVGDLLTQNPSLVAANRVQAEQLKEITGLLNEQGTETQKTANEWIEMYAKIKAATIPFASAVKNIIGALFAGLSSFMAGFLGAATAVLETFANAIRFVIGSIVNGFSAVYNDIISKAKSLPEAVAMLGGAGLAALRDAEPITTEVNTAADYSYSEKFFDGMRKASNAANDYAGKVVKSTQEIGAALGDLETYKKAISEDKAKAIKTANKNKAATSADASIGSESSKKTKARKSEAERTADSYLDAVQLRKIAEDLGLVVTSTNGGKHNRGSRHYSNLAIDVRTRDKSAEELEFVRGELQKRGVYVRDERARPKNQKVWGGAHFHLEDARLHGGKRGAKVYGEGGEVNSENFERFLAEKSDRVTKAEQDRQTMLSVEAFKTIRQMPDDDLISKYNRILIEQAQKAGKLQPSIEQTTKEFKGFSQTPEVSGDITSKPLDRRSQRFLDTDESLNITKRRKELDERRLYLADEILAKENDYILSLEEVQTDLGVETKLLEKRNLSFEAANEFSRQYNSQTKELGDVEIALDVLRRQNADASFVEQRRLLGSKREQISLEQEIGDLQDKLATQGENAALRYQSAWLKAIYDVKEADTRAVESQIESQVRIADAATVHVEQIRADVLDALASQKTMSQTIADEIVNVYEKVGDASDKFLDKTVGKIPIIGGIAKTLARSALTRITTGLLDTFLPGASQSLDKTGNPLLDESKAQTESLKNIEKAVVGVGALGSVTGGASGSRGSSGGGIAGLLQKAISFFTGNRGGTSTPPFVNNLSGGGQTSASGGSRVAGILDYFNENGTPKSGGKSGLGAIFGEGGIFGKEGFGNNVGTYSVFGAGASLLGGFISKRFGGSAIGRRLGGALSGAGTGLAIGAQIGSIIPGIGTAIGAGVGALVGGLVGLLGAGGQRKKDEKTRNQGMIDALGSIDKLIASVNNTADFTDAAGVIEQGSAIKQNYLDSMSQLKDNKTRNIALRDVSRIEEKLRQLETLAKAKAGQTKSRASALQADVPTFADGGSISNFAAKNFQNNPLGYLTGPGSARSDSILARVSNGEYVLDAATAKNLGIGNLDRLRAAKGKLKYLRTPNAYADGGAITADPMTSGGGGMLAGSINVEVRNSFTYNEADGTASVKTDVISTDASGKEFIVKTIEEEIYRNGRESRTYKANNNVAKGNR